MAIKGKTKLQLHQEKKKELNESIEYLRQVDLPSGPEFVHETRLEEKKKQKATEDQQKNRLESRISARYGYRSSLADYAFKRFMEEQFEWEAYCVSTDGTRLNVFGKWFNTQEGVVFVLKSPRGIVYIRAMSCSYDPDIDVSAIEKVIIPQMENTIDSEKGLLLSDNRDAPATLKRTKSGILLPN